MRKKRARWRIVLVVLGCVLTLLIASAVYITRPNVLRATVLNALDHPEFRVRSMGDVVFAFPSTAIIDGLEVDRAGVPPLPSGKAQPPFLRVPRARVELSAVGLLFGSVKIKRLELEKPAVTLVGSLPGAAESPERRRSILDSAAAFDWPAFSTLGALPEIRVERANLRIMNFADDRLTLARQWVLDGEGTHERGGAAHGYTITLRQVGGPVNRTPHPGRKGDPIFRLAYHDGAVDAQLGFVECEALSGLMPQALRATLDALGLQGVASVSEFSLRESGRQTARIDLANVKLKVPVEDSPAGDPFVQLGIRSGEIALSANVPVGSREMRGSVVDVDLTLSGDWRGAPAAAQLHVRGAGFEPAPGAHAILLGDRPVYVQSLRIQARVDGLELPTVATHPRFLASRRLPDALRAFFEDYQPTGRATIWFDGRMDEQQPGFAYAGEFLPQGGTVKYFRFPYRPEDVRGTIRFSPAGIDLIDLTGHHGETQIWGGGHIDNTEPTTGFDVTFYTRNLAFDRDLYAALPEEYQRLWRKADPVGITDSTVRVHRADAAGQPAPRPAQVEIDSDVIAAALTLAPEARIEHASGAIRVREGGMTIDSLTGLLNGSRTHVSGSVEPRVDADPIERFQFESADAAFERRLSLGSETGDTLLFRGVANVWGQQSVSPGVEARSFAARITSGSLLGFDAATRWNVQRGLVLVDGDRQTIDHLDLTRDGGSLALAGSTNAESDGTIRGGDFTINIADDDFSGALRGLLPPAWARYRDDLGISGAGALDAQLGLRRSSDSAAIDVNVDGAARLASMRPRLLPLRFANVAADLKIGAGRLALDNFRARCGDAAVTGKATAGWNDSDSWFEVQAKADPILLSDEVLRCLPAGLAGVLRRVDAGGRVAVTLDPLTLVSRARGDWQVSGRAGIADGRMSIGLDLAELKGELSGRCGITSAGVEIDAEFKLDSGTIDGRDIRNWSGRLTRAVDDRMIAVTLESGESCGGRIAGDAKIDPESGEYELALVLNSLALDRFLSGPSPSGQPRAGRLDGRVFLRGRGADPALRVGGGDLRIRGASLMSSPVTQSIAVESRRKNRPVAEEVDEIGLHFVWEQDELVFNRVTLSSRDLRLVGIGRWNMATDEISLTLEGATGDDAARIAVLTDLLESVSKEVMQYRVTGTSAHPRIHVEWMHNLTEPIRRLLAGDERKR